MKRDELIEKTHQYIDAFRREDYSSMTEILAENIYQTEPGNKIEGREALFGFIRKMYENCRSLNFIATDFFADEEAQRSVVEFHVEVTGHDASTASFRGCDHIRWNKEGQIESLEAFLYPVAVLS